MLHVTIVDDDTAYCEELAFSLKYSGFNTSVAHNYSQLEKVLESGKTDLILLDIGLPETDGFAVLQRLQLAGRGVGVVMLTARSDTGDRVRGLIGGADAYLVKPVDVAEISATLHAVARRLPHRRTKNMPSQNGWRLEKNSWVVVSPEGKEHALTAQERFFLQALLHTSRTQQTVTREALMRGLRRDPAIYDDHFIDTMVSRLRSKLGKDFPLQTVRGIGYTLSEPLDDQEGPAASS
ncbi:response regulator transcription factor [Gilvimarinus polysaccharolyticus]|uniref:response regulator transcription factor n=1 Tax=Gilvimarinus polysaccharolyticus TaxID=863921 RepID=UPI0006739DC9|nr:response regulator transcription factor [Gilvimarinus polysaccharolyticus]